MRHYLFAVVENPEKAAQVVRTLVDAGTAQERCGVLIHQDHLRTEELPVGETQMRDGAFGGALLGGALGAVLGGLVLGPLGLVGGGIAFTTAFATTAGLIEGALFGGIAGAGSPDRALERLSAELRKGHALLSIETPDLEAMERAEATLEAEGARVVHRPKL